MKKKCFACIEDSLIDLYINTKEKVYNHSQKSDLEHLKKQSPFLIVDYISSLINILFDRLNCHNELISEKLINREHQSKDDDNESNSVYEKLLQEHESTIRQHIKLEYQLKLQNEAFVTKIDELERKLSTIKENRPEAQSIKYEGLVSNLSKEILSLKKQIEGLNGKIKEQEKLIKQLKFKNEADIADVELKYREKFESQQKKIETLESSAYTHKTTNDITTSSKTKSNISLTKTPSYRVSNVTNSSKQMKNICLHISNEITQDNLANADKGSIDSLQGIEVFRECSDSTLYVSKEFIYAIVTERYCSTQKV